jgi:hypothetical protein
VHGPSFLRQDKYQRERQGDQRRQDLLALTDFSELIYPFVIVQQMNVEVKLPLLEMRAW